jgi:cytochrome c553
MKVPSRFVLAAALAASIAFPSAAQHAAPAAPVAPSQPAAAQGAAAAPAQAAPAAPAKPDANLGGQKYDAVCAACHGAAGNSGTPANPKLAQQHPDYIVKQLQEFKSGKRPSPIMQGFAAQLTDADMRNIAAFVGGSKAKPGFAKDKELVALGERIYRGGIGNRQLPACAGCHSPNGAGIPAQYPRLGGQHADYTTAQLVAFRDGVRKNSPQMVQIASKLNDREIRAVADYIAGLR